MAGKGIAVAFEKVGRFGAHFTSEQKHINWSELRYCCKCCCRNGCSGVSGVVAGWRWRKGRPRGHDRPWDAEAKRILIEPHSRVHTVEIGKHNRKPQRRQRQEERLCGDKRPHIDAKENISALKGDLFDEGVRKAQRLGH